MLEETKNKKTSKDCLKSETKNTYLESAGTAFVFSVEDVFS